MKPFHVYRYTDETGKRLTFPAQTLGAANKLIHELMKEKVVGRLGFLVPVPDSEIIHHHRQA